MKIGLGTYTYFWQIAARGDDDSFLEEMLEDAAGHGGQVFQICDYPPLDGFDAARLRSVRREAEALGIELEIGTRGVTSEHLERYLEIADALGARLVRSMFSRAGEVPDLAQATRELASALPRYRASGVTLGLETYEQVPVTDMLRIIDELGTERFGVCLDPANGIGAYEMPQDTIARTAPYVVNVHVKDFAFARRGGAGVHGDRPRPRRRGTRPRRDVGRGRPTRPGREPHPRALGSPRAGRRRDRGDRAELDGPRHADPPRPGAGVTATRPRAVIVGEALIDELVDGVRRTSHPGGSPMNVAYGLGRLGIDTLLVTSLGDDAHGSRIREHLAGAPVRLLTPGPTPAATSVAVARLGADGDARYDFEITWELAPLSDTVPHSALVHADPSRCCSAEAPR